MIYYTNYLSYIGTITLLSDGDALTGLRIKDGKKYLASLNQKAEEKDNLLIFIQTIAYLDSYFYHKEDEPIPVYKLDCTPFQREVYSQLMKVKYGQTISYEELGKHVAFAMNKTNMSSQAIGTALAKNSLPLIIPCHRVINKSGELGNYTPGKDIKKVLLDLEKEDK